ncbi:hypothetical protein ACS0TY_019600 [Phlomoides rotata]
MNINAFRANERFCDALGSAVNSSFENLSLLEDEDDELLLEPDSNLDGAHDVEFNVVGRFLTN